MFERTRPQSRYISPYKQMNYSRNNEIVTLTPSQELDLEYLTLVEAICQSQFYEQSTRHVKIRVKKWLQKLDQLILNHHWKQKRNRYAKTLYFMCQCELLIAPFDHLPPEKQIANIEPYQMNEIIDVVERKVEQRRREKDKCYDCQKEEKRAKNQALKQKYCKSYAQSVEKTKKKPSKPWQKQQINDSVETSLGLTPYEFKKSFNTKLLSNNKAYTTTTVKKDRKSIKKYTTKCQSNLPAFYQKRKKEHSQTHNFQIRTEISPQKLYSYYKFYENLTKGDLIESATCSTDENISINSVRVTRYFSSKIHDEGMKTPLKSTLVASR